VIVIKNKASLQKMSTAGQLLNEIFREIVSEIRSGVSTLELDQLIARLIKEKGLSSKTMGYMGYCHSSCISLNDEVVHGVPSAMCFLERTLCRYGTSILCRHNARRCEAICS